MNKQEFLTKLKDGLKELPYYEVEKISSYYEEIINDKIDDNISEKKAVESLGSITKIIKETKEELDVTNIITTKVKEVYTNTTNKTMLIIIAILLSPVWVPILFSIIALIFSFYILVFSIIVSLLMIPLSILIVSIVTFISAIAFIPVNISSSILLLGTSFVSFGIFIVLIKLVISLIKLIFNYHKKLLISISRKILKKEGV